MSGLTIILITVGVIRFYAEGGSLENPSPEFLKIQVEGHSRDYTSGPVGGQYMLSNHDQILLTLEEPEEGYIYRWAMVSTSNPISLCELSRVYDSGYKVSLICPGPEAVYYAYATKTAITSLEAGISAALTEYLEGEAMDDPKHCKKGEDCMEAFVLLTKMMVLRQDKTKLDGLLATFELKSDPIKLIATEYCFLWAYSYEELGKVGYVFTEAEPTGSEGSYIKYRIYMWITEANAMTNEELERQFIQTVYSGIITSGFKGKGLEPCFRFSHQAIKLLSPDPLYMYDPMGEGIYWEQEFVVHTDTIASSLSDISFTITSRQHIALYGCFVAETRVLLDPRQFSFLSARRNDPQKVNIDNSAMSPVQRSFIKQNLKHIYGHYVQYVGRPWEFESARHRRDVVVFQNPCMTVESCFSVRGVTYMAQDWMQLNAGDDITQVTLPGMDEDDIALVMDAGEEAEEKTLLSRSYIKAFDFVLTPTHLVVLTADSSVYFHPTSVIYKGFGFLKNLQFYRPGALVTRRWCATTVTPKEHNMVVPAFSIGGSFVVIQIVPVEKTVSMWLQPPTEVCLESDDDEDEGSSNRRGKKHEMDNIKEGGEDHLKLLDKIEYCIHRHEVPKRKSKKLDDDSSIETEEKRSKECKRLFPKMDESKNEKESNLDSLLMYWLAGDTPIDEEDPHFVHEVSEASVVRTSSSSANYNTHTLYEVDRRGRKIIEALAESGLIIQTQSKIANLKHLMWLHDVQFTAAERRYLLVVEFKSTELKKIGTALTVINLIILDEPIRVYHYDTHQMVEIDILFSGTLIVQPLETNTPHSNETSSSRRRRRDSKDPDAAGEGGDGNKDRLHGTVKAYTMNSAMSNYLIHIDARDESNKQHDVLLYATFEGAHARPLIYYYEVPDSAQRNEEPKSRVRFTQQHPVAQGEEGVLKPDVSMTEHGIISVLIRKANLSDSDDNIEPKDNFPQSVIIGSIVVPDPLRRVNPFKGDSYVFQRVTADGEIVYGVYSFANWMDNETEAEPLMDFMPNLIDVETTNYLSIPFESMLGGNDDADKEPRDDISGDAVTSSDDKDVCPFVDFVVHYIPFDFAEVEYRTRVTAELVFRGSSIPLEADILVEFDDNHGISVEINSGIESSRDQTLVRKTIDIFTFLTPNKLNSMYEADQLQNYSQETSDEVTVFSLTMRPSMINLHCPKNLFFKTITINVGCNPFTTMRFVAEAVGLKKVNFHRSTSNRHRENSWTVTQNGEDYEVTIPHNKVNFAQRKMFKCTGTETSTTKKGFCTIPKAYANLFKENIYEMRFSLPFVPKFEQFLTRHVRRVTGNIFLFDILGGSGMSTNTTLLDAECHNMGPPCALLDESCISLVNVSLTQRLRSQPWTTMLMERMKSGEIDYRSGIYEHYRSCFSDTRETRDSENIPLNQELPSKMKSEKFWIFNSTNYNAFSLEKHRNMIFIIRAVVINTPENAYTFCEKLETYFVVQVTGVSPARQPLSWSFYLALVTLVLFIFIVIYFCFARSSQWQSEVSARKIREEEERAEREAEAKAFLEKQNNYALWAQKLRGIAQDQEKGKPVISREVFAAPTMLPAEMASEANGESKAK